MARGEATARRLVRARSGGVCEVCARQPATDWHHRLNRSQGGTWSASNGLDLDRQCHRFVTEHPAAARDRGWALRAGQDPATEPVHLAWTGLVRLDDAGGITRLTHTWR